MDSYKFTKILKVFCSKAFELVSVVGELPGAEEEVSKPKPRVGVLSLKVGSSA